MDPFANAHLGMPSSSLASPAVPPEKRAAAPEPAANAAAISALLWFGDFLGCERRETSRLPPHLSKEGAKRPKACAAPATPAVPVSSPTKPAIATPPPRLHRKAPPSAAAPPLEDPALSDMMDEMSSFVEVDLDLGEDISSACSSPPLVDVRHAQRPDTKTKAPRSRSHKAVAKATEAAQTTPTAPSTMWHETTAAPVAASSSARPGARVKRPRERLSL